MSGTAKAYVFENFDETKKVEGTPQGCLWGFYDEDGKKDQVGSINLLTPEVVKEASKEVQSGRHVQLDWPLHSLSHPGFGRKKFSHKVLSLKESLGAYGFDDEVHINTQSGSQWDSLRHHACPSTQAFYNGLTFEESLTSERNGTHNWCERGGIVGRGLLVDMVRYYEKRDGAAPNPITRHEIQIQDVVEAMKEQGSVPRQGDLLMIRTGFIRWHNQASDQERKQGTFDNHQLIGLEASEATVRWLYDQHFAAVISDTVAVEAWPPQRDSPWIIHNWALVWWGTPLGEMWDLEGLSRECERHQRWTFMVTSAPLHVKGGVGSPPGAIAIF